MNWSWLHLIGDRFLRVKHSHYTQAEFDQFWKHPVWLNVQRQIAVEIGEYLNIIQRTQRGEAQEIAAKASITVLDGLFGSRNFLKNYVVEKVDEKHLKVRAALGKALAELDSVMQEYDL